MFVDGGGMTDECLILVLCCMIDVLCEKVHIPIFCCVNAWAVYHENGRFPPSKKLKAITAVSHWKTPRNSLYYPSQK